MGLVSRVLDETGLDVCLSKTDKCKYEITTQKCKFLTFDYQSSEQCERVIKVIPIIHHRQHQRHCLIFPIRELALVVQRADSFIQWIKCIGWIRWITIYRLDRSLNNWALSCSVHRRSSIFCSYCFLSSNGIVKTTFLLADTSASFSDLLLS